MTEHEDDLSLSNVRFETLAVHAGVEPDPLTGAVMTPIYQTSTYAQEDVGVHKGYDYARSDNPTRSALQAALAALEGGRYALAFASGMAAIDTLLRLVRPGERVVCGNDLYGGTFRLFHQILSSYGIQFSFVNAADPEVVRAAIGEQGGGGAENQGTVFHPSSFDLHPFPLSTGPVRLVWLETPTNPLLRLANIAAIAEIAHAAGAYLAVDNTFASPALQQPLALGADFVIHSTTKYIGGHSDVVGGAIVLNDTAVYERLKFLQNAIGAVPGPLDCFLTLRGLKTLALRMRAHCHNATQVARFLFDHPAVADVYFPGLDNHPQHELARRQMSGPGGMVSFTLHGGEPAARAIARYTHLFTLAESLGGVESLIELPAPMTHATVLGPEAVAAGFAIDPGLVRLSVGIENADDLISDLAQALKRLEV
jgi:cystathionine beta-lyase/cystathionine gamma-synthase